VNLLIANLLSLVLLVLARFVIADSYVWGGRSLGRRRPALTHVTG
jgi:hypothetical protein